MAKSKELHEKDIVAIIKKLKICRISHIFGHYVEIKRAQFYNLELDESDIIKEALLNNRSKGAGYLLNKWMNSDNPTLQLAAMRLICEPEEHRLLNQQYIEQSGSTGVIIKVDNTTKDIIDELTK